MVIIFINTFFAASNMIQTMRIKNANNVILGITGFCETFVPNSVYTQCIRWKRKPIWMPTAKSKVFRIPKKPVIPLEEQLETQRLYNNYRTYMTSLRYLYICIPTHFNNSEIISLIIFLDFWLIKHLEV